MTAATHYAQQWFDRCWFAHETKNTLLHHLLFWGTDPERYLDTWDSLKTVEQDKEEYKKNPEKFDEEEMSFIDDDITFFGGLIQEMTEGWKPETELDMEEQIEIIKEFVKQREQLINEGDEKNERAADQNNGEASTGDTKDVGV